MTSMETERRVYDIGEIKIDGLEPTPEMKELLESAGIRNYTIWNAGEELFGYYECEKGAAYAAKVQAESPVVDRWNAYMADVMEMELDPETGAQPRLAQVFLFDPYGKA